MTPAKPAESGHPPIDWNAVLDEHRRWLRCVVLARVGEPQAVDEVLQEVALAAVSSRNPPRPEKAAPWLYRVAVRQTLLYRRKQGRQRKLVDRYAQQYEPCEAEDRETDPLVWLIARERASLVRAALGKLARGDSEILLLKYCQGWSYHRIAERLGVSHSAVETRLHRARKRLRSELAGVGEWVSR